MHADRADEPREPTAWETAMAEHERRLVVGARVRVRLSPECEYCDKDGGDGQEGVIVGTELDADTLEGADEVIRAHHFRVRYGDIRGDDWSGYCAAELIPIPWATPERDPDTNGVPYLWPLIREWKKRDDLLLPVQREDGGGDDDDA